VKSSKKPRDSNVDVTARASDVNISGVSSTPASDAGESATTRRTRRTVHSMPSLTEIPPPLEIPPPVDSADEELVVQSSFNDEIVPPSNSNEAMVHFHLSICIFYANIGSLHLSLRPKSETRHKTELLKTGFRPTQFGLRLKSNTKVLV